MENLKFFPHLNAGLNALSGVFLLLGFYFIRQNKVHLHRASMLTAVGTSTLFLASYLSSKIIFGIDSVKFAGEGLIRPIYFFILITHTILAAGIVPFILVTLWRALKGRFEIHKKLARWVFPVWLYVSVTGVIVYLLLYQLFPSK
jgi:putative membrane protein